MKKVLILFLFLVYGISFSQYAGNDNRFSQEESNTSSRDEIKPYEPSNNTPQDTGGPGNPGDPQPIDDYIPLLMITALGTIAYITRKKKLAKKNI